MNDEQKHPLILRLESMASENSPDRGALAKLRRGFEDPVETYPIVLPFLRNDVSNRELNLYAAVASLFAIHPKAGGSGNFGQHMRFAAGENIEATERRFVALLRAHVDDLPEVLRHAVSFLRSKDIPVNWEQLRKDLLAWDHPDGYVQKNWARGFWGYQNSENNQSN